MAAAYSIPAAPLELTEEIKKSRFITLIAHTPTVEAAKGWVNEIKRQYPTARHTAGRLWRVRRKIAKSMASAMMANRPVRRASRSWPS